MAKTAAAKADSALSTTLKSRKAKAAVRGSRAQTASKPALEGEQTIVGRVAAVRAAPAVAPPEETLRAFDLELQYGPCGGLTRLERWERATQLGFGPPERIRILLKELPAPDYQISVFGRL